ncbi:acyl-CoA dehydrogenase family protein [Nocardia miyunensis]|uniref:acyl-CoA dehydrogenase family protein n=1 Tax=Nocardia miyunensis TaxID=282684 RepID=UPI000A02A1E7|nr:acyl-CoA dehydrogenase family protein [Nocardia miyunensis]
MTSPTTSRFPQSPYLSEEGRRMRDAIRAAAPGLAARARAGEEQGVLTLETVSVLHEIGVFRITIPVELGGFALGAHDTMEVVRALGRVDGSAGWTVIVSSAVRSALVFGERVRDEIFADVTTWEGPLLFGATVFAPKVGDGRKVDGGWMVKGRWPYGSGSKIAKWGTVGFEYDDPDTGQRRRAMAMLTRDQYTIVDDWHVMGMSATASNTVQADEEVFVPEYRVVHTAEVPARTDALRGKYQGLGFMHSGIGTMVATTVAFAALALGMTEGALEAFVTQAKKRAPFNLPYPTMADMASTQVVAGKARAVVNTAAAVIERQADEIDRRALAGEDIHPWEEPEITMDLVHQIHQCLQVIDGLQLALGSSTVGLSNPLQRFVRDVHVLATHGAFRIDPMAEINGRDIFGLEPLPVIAALSSPPPAKTPAHPAPNGIPAVSVPRSV